jgi:hypothetical protein
VASAIGVTEPSSWPKIKAIEAERDAMLAPVKEDEVPIPAKTLMGLKGIGAEFAIVLCVV